MRVTEATAAAAAAAAAAVGPARGIALQVKLTGRWPDCLISPVEAWPGLFCAGPVVTCPFLSVIVCLTGWLGLPFSLHRPPGPIRKRGAVESNSSERACTLPGCPPRQPLQARSPSRSRVPSLGHCAGQGQGAQVQVQMQAQGPGLGPGPGSVRATRKGKGTPSPRPSDFASRCSSNGKARSRQLLGIGYWAMGTVHPRADQPTCLPV